MAKASKTERGRGAFRKQAWSDAYALLSSADKVASLAPGDLELLAKAAYLTGKYFDCTDAWNRAHHAFLKQGKIKRAANCAFWLGMILINQGDHAQGSGWIARATRLVEENKHDCVEQGFLLLPKGLQSLSAGESGKAHDLFSEAVEIGTRFNNQDLITLGRLGLGQALIFQNKISEGTTLFDEVMVAVLSDEISPIVTGIVYCAVIETCQKIYDLGRAQEWTEALSRWCDSQPDLVPFRGQCLVRRVEIMQFHGEWKDAMNEGERACDLLSQPPGESAAGEAWYRQGELFRLLGKFSKSEEMYRQASKWGRKPQPGLALLRLAQGEIKDAVTAIRQSEEEEKDLIKRSKVLPAYVEIMLAAGEISAARTFSRELSEIAVKLQAPFLQAIAARASGSILLADEDARGAHEKLREAWTLFNKIDAVYESAKTRMLIGRACREIGDNDTAEMELDAARWHFQQLGAAHDLEKVESLIRKSPADNINGLTSRELEVLRFLATGKTNKAIAADLFISERTVDRHVSNILSKLNISSRAAATAYAYEHDLI
ncbi:MAG: response regulator transcription factor [Gracilimonas sp.]|uniref:LuxR C-terminal-related transcriptional regulator n=1 Tax=Gracilimonas sp. TaxID=1974203 RepID=UPI0019A6C33E|nr:LuxR C-terminal-related transcriptional regulator [Gracilimonas sp.]MBD3615247.1 response regulator transcription factor [Gracilimonas sp.]